jgi:hypothetical protein
MSAERMLARDNDDFRSVLNTPEGARVIAGIVDFCGIYTANPSGNMYAEGMRNVGLMLYRRVTDAPGGEERLIAARRDRMSMLSRGKEEKNG